MTTAENKHVFMRPIEVIASQSITFPDSGEITITAGVYANAATLCASITNQITGSEEVLISDDGYIGIYLPNGGSVTFNDAQLKFSLGFLSNISGAGAGSVTEGAQRPPTVWISEHQTGNQDHWKPKLNERFAGATAGDGTLAGNVRGPRIYHRKFSFPHESAANVSQQFGTSTGKWWNCFEIWSEKAMTAYPDENNVPMRGFFHMSHFYEAVVAESDRTANGHEYTYWFDSTWISTYDGLTDLTATYPGIATENEMTPWMDNSTTGKYYYLFCMMPERGVAFQNDASVPAGRGYYNVEFDCHTANQPTNGWTFTT